MVALHVGQLKNAYENVVKTDGKCPRSRPSC
jgi:hypothetical protein